MLVLNRFVVASERTAAFTQQAQVALAALAARPGYRGGEVIRSVDEPERWCLVTRWESIGAYRRALGDFDVRIHATPLLADSVNEPSAYEILTSVAPGGAVTATASDRAQE